MDSSAWLPCSRISRMIAPSTLSPLRWHVRTKVRLRRGRGKGKKGDGGREVSITATRWIASAPGVVRTVS